LQQDDWAAVILATQDVVSFAMEGRPCHAIQAKTRELIAIGPCLRYACYLLFRELPISRRTACANERIQTDLAFYYA
jgi:hypothetical protein